MLSLPAIAAADDRAQDDRPVATGASGAGVSSGRLAFVGAGALLVTGFGLGYWAQGQAQRAETTQAARASRAQLDRARSTAQAANLMYALAGAALIYGVALELLPEKVADKASLTFHF